MNDKEYLDKAKSLVTYSPDTGNFTWNVKCGKASAGDVAGWLDTDGHIQIQVARRNSKAHRLAWAFVHGEFPKGQIDHINGIPVDNRICNLRDVSPAINQQNKRQARSDSTTKLIGASPNRKKYQARIKISGKLTHIGMFDTPEEAHAAYIDAKRKYHEGCTI